ncbi:hypothetical protein EMPG_10651, partial [Blastomyces silverae]
MKAKFLRSLVLSPFGPIVSGFSTRLTKRCYYYAQLSRIGSCPVTLGTIQNVPYIRRVTFKVEAQVHS